MSFCVFRLVKSLILQSTLNSSTNCPRELNSIDKDKYIIYVGSEVQIPTTTKKNHQLTYLIYPPITIIYKINDFVYNSD